MAVEILCETCHYLAEALWETRRMEWTGRIPIYAYVILAVSVSVAALTVAVSHIHDIVKKWRGGGNL